MAWTPTNTVNDWADHLRVVVGGKDVTFFRATDENPTPTQVGGWQHTDPYGWNNASLSFPAITEFDDLDNGPIRAWLYEGAQVRIDRVLNGAVVTPGDPLFFGIIERIEIDSDGGVSATCNGDFMARMGARLHQPDIMLKPARDGGTLIYNEVYGRHAKLLPQGGAVTGINLAANGSRDMTRLGYIDDILGRLITEAGDSWTLLPDPAAGPHAQRMQKRTMATVNATIDAGAHGVKVNLARDLVDMVNRLHGEGVAPNGERYRNAVYPRIHGDVPTFPGVMQLGSTNADTTTGSGVSVLTRRLWALNLLGHREEFSTEFTAETDDAVKEFQDGLNLAQTGVVDAALWRKLWGADFAKMSFRQAHFRPFAADTRTEFWLYGPNGTPVDLNPRYDRDVFPVEAFEGFGNRVRKREAKRYARARIKRGGDRVGTITLTSDPAEMSRFDLRAGMTLKVRHLAGMGTTGVNVYVSSVQVDWASGSVTCAVSTTAKHYLELAQIVQRNLEARRDPARHARHQFRRSNVTSDAIMGWEGESGAGEIEDTPLLGGQWNVVQFVGAQVGTIGDWRLEVDAPTEFCFGVFGDGVAGTALDNTIGDPFVWGNAADRTTKFVEHLDWLQDPDRLFIEGWGTPEQPCGYGSKPHTNDQGSVTSAPLTGKFRDQGQWTFESPTGFLWLAVYPKANCTIHGRARVALNEGV